MVVCKFFLQGTCKFGDYCKFEHQVPANYTSFADSSPSSTSILRQSNFGAPQPTIKPTNVDTTALVNAVMNDMTQAEKGGQWLFSSYAPFKEKPAFPGFTDQSFEEIRLGFYEAQKNGTVEQYKQQLQVMLQELMTKVKALQNPSSEIVNMLKVIYNSPPSSCSGVFGTSNASTAIFATSGNTTASSNSIFGQPNSGFNQQSTGTSIFAKTNQSVFGTTPAQPSTNIFGGNTSNNPTNVFGATPQQQNVFSTPAPPQGGSIFQNSQQPNRSVFAQNSFTNQSNIFAQANQALNKPTSIFRGNTQQNQSVFAQPQQQPGNSPFVQQQGNIFAKPQNSAPPAQQNANIFAQPFIQQQQPIFGQTPAQNVSPLAPQVQQQPANIFPAQSPPQTSVFGEQAMQSQNPNVFAQNIPKVDANSALTHSAAIFGTSVPQNLTVNPQSQSILSVKQQESIVDVTIYSKVEELSEAEKKWFESDDLDIANIPENPPPYELVC